MDQKYEANILADVFEDAHSLTKFYLAKTAGLDPRRSYGVEGRSLNTLYWIVGHIVWAEHYLLVHAMTGESMHIPWIERFDEGLTDEPGLPSMEEIMHAMDQVHDRAMTIVRGFTDEELDMPNFAGIRFMAGDSRRVIIRHAIRHEPMHVGQISWICRINGIETP